jgi:hypothetical protein
MRTAGRAQAAKHGTERFQFRFESRTIMRAHGHHKPARLAEKSCARRDAIGPSIKR